MTYYGVGAKHKVGGIPLVGRKALREGRERLKAEDRALYREFINKGYGHHTRQSAEALLAKLPEWMRDAYEVHEHGYV